MGWRKGRAKEMQCVEKHAVCEKVPLSQCSEETGKNKIKTALAETNNG